MKLESIFCTIFSVVLVSCSSTGNLDDTSTPSSGKDITQNRTGTNTPKGGVPDSASGDDTDEEDENKKLQIKIDALIECYKGNAKPNAKPNSNLCIDKLKKDWKFYFQSVKIYSDKIPEGIDRKKMILQRQPVNIAMGTAGYDHAKWKKFLNESGLEDADGQDSFYTKYYSINKKLAPNIALFCKSPVLDDSDPRNPKTHDMGILSVIGLGFDSNEQADYKYFLETDGKNFKVDKKKEFAVAMRSVFEKIINCATEHGYKNIYLDGFGCGAFAGLVKKDVIGVYNSLFTEYEQKCRSSGIKLINAYTSTPKLFEGGYSKMNCFTREWNDKHGKIEETLFINNWDPHSLPGNGNNSDSSVDGGYGRHAPISLVGCAAINQELLKEKNFIVVNS